MLTEKISANQNQMKIGERLRVLNVKERKDEIPGPILSDVGSLGQ